jgi:hypothetical protein
MWLSQRRMFIHVQAARRNKENTMHTRKGLCFLVMAFRKRNGPAHQALRIDLPRMCRRLRKDVDIG